MRAVFADSGFWIAVLSPGDWLHDRALAARAAGARRMITSEAVLTEVLNFFADRGPHLRRAAVNLVRMLRHNPNAVIVSQTSRRFADAVTLYERRSDKTWGLTD